jgi:uncharacterized protein (DUF983 family)
LEAHRPSLLGAILHERCPRCREGAVYRGPVLRTWLAMNERCPECGLKFEREQGYFIGAMYVSYALAIPPYILLVTGFWLLAHWRYEFALLGAFVAYLPFVPLAARFSRVVWMFIDRHFDPDIN